MIHKIKKPNTKKTGQTRNTKLTGRERTVKPLIERMCDREVENGRMRGFGRCLG